MSTGSELWLQHTYRPLAAQSRKSRYPGYPAGHLGRDEVLAGTGLRRFPCGYGRRSGKNDTPDQAYTQAVYRDLRERLDREFPEAALVSEWNAPRHALGCGFDMDFYLSWTGNGYHSLMRSYDPKSKDTPIGPDRSYFKADSGADPMHFLGEYLPNYLKPAGRASGASSPATTIRSVPGSI